MKIGIIGATGKSGQFILEEAKSKGHDVTAIVRNKSKLKQTDIKSIEKDLFDLTTEDLKDFDIVVDAFNASNGQVELHETSLKHLTTILANTTTRLFIVGGAGSLYTDLENKIQLKDGKDFPDAYKPTAIAMGNALETLRSVKNVNWLYISPAAMFDAEGEKTGHYVLAGEEFTTDDSGNSSISYADYALALVDQFEKTELNQVRISVRH